MESLVDSTTFNVLMEQLHLLVTNKHGRCYNKHVLIFATEVLNISPAACRMLRR